MQEKQYKIGNRKYRLSEFTVKKYKLVFSLISKTQLKQFYTVTEDNKFKIEAGKIVTQLASQNQLEKFLSLILEPVKKNTFIAFIDYLRILFGRSNFSNISDEVLVEVLADFFTGKLSLLKGLMDSFIPFWKNINLPLTKLDQYQV